MSIGCSFVKCLFKSLAPFCTGLSDFFLNGTLKSYFYILYMSPLPVTCTMNIFHSVACFYFLHGVFDKEEFLSFLSQFLIDLQHAYRKAHKSSLFSLVNHQKVNTFLQPAPWPRNRTSRTPEVSFPPPQPNIVLASNTEGFVLLSVFLRVVPFVSG